MIYIWEFEFVQSESEKCVLAFPCSPMGGGTFGDDLVDAVEMAADYLACMVDEHLMNGTELPPMEFGHKSEHDGRIIAVAVARSIEDIPAITAADAAKALGVSRARVTQLCNAGMLDSWMSGSNRMVSKTSVDARIEERIRKQVEQLLGADLACYDEFEIAYELHRAGIDDIDKADKDKVDAIIRASRVD